MRSILPTLALPPVDYCNLGVISNVLAQSTITVEPYDTMTAS